MSFIGRPISLALVAVVALLLTGTVGVTVLYQSSASALETQNEQLREQNYELRQELRSVNSERRELEDENEELNETIAELEETVERLEDDRDDYRSDLETVCDEWNTSVDSKPSECP